jgi:hypothetical protein
MAMHHHVGEQEIVTLEQVGRDGVFDDRSDMLRQKRALRANRLSC